MTNESSIQCIANMYRREGGLDHYPGARATPGARTTGSLYFLYILICLKFKV